MAKKKTVYIRKQISLTREDNQALDSAALTLERDPQWVLGKLAHLAVGSVPLSVEIRAWLRGDTAWDAGLPGDQRVLMTIENPDPPVVRAPRRKTVAENPPSLEEVARYVAEKGYSFDAEAFHAFYTANGWVQGRAGKPLLDWKAAATNWSLSDIRKAPVPPEPVSDWGANRPPEADAPSELTLTPEPGPDEEDGDYPEELEA